MAKYTVSGVDDETGMQTSMVLEAPSQDEAVRVGISRGIRPVRSDGQLPASHADIAAVVMELQAIRLELANVQRSEAAFLTDAAARKRLRTTIAWGIVNGLLLWVVLPLVVFLIAVLIVASSAGWLN